MIFMGNSQKYFSVTPQVAMFRPYTRGPSYTIPVDPQQSPPLTPQPDNELYVLDLRPFVETPKVDFGTVSIGSYVTREVWIRNSYDVAVQMVVEKITKDDFEANPMNASIEGGSNSRMLIGWLPMKEGPTRGLIRLLVNKSFRVQLLVLGNASGSCKMRKSRHPGSRRHHLDYSKSCQLLPDIENITASSFPDEGDGDGYYGNDPQENNDWRRHRSPPFTNPSCSYTFVLDRSHGNNIDTARSPKTPLRMIDNRVESFADDKSTEHLRRATYCKKDLLSKRTTTYVHPLDVCYNSNNNNKNVQKQDKKKTVARRLFRDKKVASNPSTPPYQTPLSRKLNLVAITPKDKMPAKGSEPVLMITSKMLDREHLKSVPRNPARFYSENKSLKPSWTPLEFISSDSLLCAKSEILSPQNIDLVGMSRMVSEFTNLHSRCDTYTKLNDGLDSKEELFEDSIECVDRTDDSIECVDRTDDSIDKYEYKRKCSRVHWISSAINSENESSNPISPICVLDVRTGIVNDLDNIFPHEEFQSTENVKLTCYKHPINVSIINYKAKISKKTNAENVPDVCQVSPKSKVVKICTVKKKQTDEDHSRPLSYRQCRTSTPRMTLGRIGTCTLSSIHDTKTISETPMRVITKSNLRASMKQNKIDVSRPSVHKKKPQEVVADNQDNDPGLHPSLNKSQPLVSGLCHKSSVKKFVSSVKNHVRSKSGSFNTSPKITSLSLFSSFHVPKRQLKLKKLEKEKPANKILTSMNPCTSNDIHFDEVWIQEQERGFTEWMNFALVPPEFLSEPLRVTVPTFVDTKSLCLSQEQDDPRANLHLQNRTRNAPELNLYSTEKKVKQLRKKACNIYQSAAVSKVVDNLEKEVSSGMLAIRTDRFISADYNLRTSIKILLFSYNIVWLRIGLETVYGEILDLESLSQKSIEKFLDVRFFSCPSIMETFAHPTISQLYNGGFQSAMSKFILKKFLFLVYFLDVAKSIKFIDYDPCLFNTLSIYKSSRDILLAFSRICLRGEGNLTRHLSNLGCRVTHQQTAMEEFDYTVTNLFQDLRDGIRLARLVDVLTGDLSLTKQLQPLPLNKAKKMFNIEVVLDALRQRNVSLFLNKVFCEQITSKDIMEGHRERTLELVWRIIFSLQVTQLLDEELLIKELKVLFKELHISLRKQLGSISWNSQVLDATEDSPACDFHQNNLLFVLLLRWCRIVCINYGLKVDNFSTCFSDGRAFCYLIHHYHPLLLPLTSIQSETTLSYRRIFSLKGTAGKNVVRFGCEKMNQLLANEKLNFKLFSTKLSELGGVPLTIVRNDSAPSPPDGKLVITCVAFMCSRLLGARTELHAAKVVQRWWKRISHKGQSPEAKPKLKIAARQKSKGNKKRKNKSFSLGRLPAKIEFQEKSLSSMMLLKIKKAPLKSKILLYATPQLRPSLLKLTCSSKPRTSGLIDYVSHRNNRPGRPYTIIKSLSASSGSCHKNAKETHMYVRSPANGDLIRKSDISKDVFDSGKLDKVMDELARGYDACKSKLNGIEVGIAEKKPQTSSIDSKSPISLNLEFASNIQMFAVHNLYSGKHLNRISLDYDDEVVENLGLNRTGTIYYTPKKEASIKLSHGDEHCSIDNHVEEMASHPVIEIRMEKSCSENLEIFSPREAPKVIIEKTLTFQEPRMLKNSSYKKTSINQTINCKEHDCCFTGFQPYKSYIREGNDKIPEFSSGDFEFRKPEDNLSNCFKEHINMFDDNLIAYKCDEKFRLIETSSSPNPRKDENNRPIKQELDRYDMTPQMVDDVLFRSQTTSYNDFMIDAIDECCLGIENLSIESRVGSPCSERKKEKGMVEGKNSNKKLMKVSLSLLKRTWIKYLLLLNPRSKYPVARRYFDQVIARQDRFMVDKDHIFVLLKQEFSNQFLSMICTNICKSWYFKSQEIRSANCRPNNFETFFINKHWRTMKHNFMITKRSMEGPSCWRAKREFLELKHENVIHYENNMSKTVMIQSVMKIFMAKMKFQKELESIIKVQSCVRSFLAQRKLKTKLDFDDKMHLIVPSSLDKSRGLGPEEDIASMTFRYLKTSQQLRWSCFTKKRARQQAARKIQAFWRRFHTKKNYLKLRELMRIRRRAVPLKSDKIFSSVQWSNAVEKIIKCECATEIQAFWRGHVARKDYHTLKYCLVSIRYLERICLWKKGGLFFLTLWSDVLERKIKCESAYKLQTFWRCQRACARYLEIRHNIINLQVAIRKYIARKNHQKIMTNTTDVQRLCRTYAEKEKYKEKLNSIIHLQACVRMFKKRQEFLKMKRSVVIIQSLERRRICMKNFEQQRNRTIRLQSLARMVLERKARLAKEKKLVKVQSWVRRFLARKKYLRTVDKIKKCQNIVRGWVIRKHLNDLKNKIIITQSFTRMIIERKKYLKTVERVVFIQRISKGFVYREIHKYVLKIVKTQAVVRGYLNHRRYERQLKNVVAIQSLARGFLVRRRLSSLCSVAVGFHCFVGEIAKGKVVDLITAHVIYRLKLHRSAEKIQTRWRGWIARKTFRAKMQSVLMLQAVVRSYRERREVARKMESLLLIQSWWRRMLRMKEAIRVEIEAFRKKMTERERICSKLRGEISAAKIQNCYRRHVRSKMEVAAACRIQTFWRGVMARKRNPEVRPVLLRLMTANKTATKLKNLYSKTLSALDNLLKYKNLSSILEALVKLDMVTRLSSTCCEKIAESRTMSTIIQLIQSCNRSVPHQELVKYSSSVLLNLAKCNKTTDALFGMDNLISTIIRLMVVYKEKEEVFINASNILIVFAGDENKRPIIMKSEKVAEKFSSIHDFLSRKYELEKKFKAKHVEVVTSGLPLCHHCCHASDVVYEMAVDKGGVGGGARVQNFSRSFQAIQHLMTALDMSIR